MLYIGSRLLVGVKHALTACFASTNKLKLLNLQVANIRQSVCVSEVECNGEKVKYIINSYLSDTVIRQTNLAATDLTHLKTPFH